MHWLALPIALLGFALGAWRARARLRSDPALTVENAHRSLRELICVPMVGVPCVLALVALLKNYWLLWYLPAALDEWSLPLLWVLSGGLFAYLAGVGLPIAFAQRHRERYKLAFASLALIGALGSIHVRSAWPIYRQLSEDQTPDGYVLQTSDFSCAAAALANVAKMHGMQKTEKEMAQLAATSSSGTSPGQILRALRRIGLRGIKRTGTLDELPHMRNPCILLVEYPGLGPDSHAIVLPAQAGKALRVIDPLGGPPSFFRQSLAQTWGGRMIECVRE